ncbi:hypothetical protein ACFWP3_20970 [Streptomyces sp. NPDC058525]|uniref:hypothetical protein n=1 Tax=Streptomyces sp. NPDC058525 TaxID=3346538 RepID=UPI003646C871
MSVEERQAIAGRVMALRELMYEVVDSRSPLVPEPLRPGFQAALRDLDDRRAFEEVVAALQPPDIEEALDRVGLLGQQLALKLTVIDWAWDRADGAWRLAQQAGSPEEPEAEDAAAFDAADPPGESDPGRRARWRRARKLLAKVLKIIDDLFASLIKAIPGVGEPIVEAKQALESVLDR